jgi:hypothetical protein
MSTPRAVMLAITSWATLLSGIWLVASYAPSSLRSPPSQPQKSSSPSSSKPSPKQAQQPTHDQAQEKTEQDDTKRREIGSFAETGILEL